MDFGKALKELRAGWTVSRAGWNGKDMYLSLQLPDENSLMTLPYIWMKTADFQKVPWLASQTDLLAEDWEIATKKVELKKMESTLMHNLTSPRPENDETHEQEIIRKGLTAPRLTPENIESAIKDTDFHVFPGTQLTVCCLTLRNGYTVVGESACASPSNFDAEIGRRIARENAKQKIWALEGYLLKEKLHHA